VHQTAVVTGALRVRVQAGGGGRRGGEVDLVACSRPPRHGAAPHGAVRRSVDETGRRRETRQRQSAGVLMVVGPSTPRRRRERVVDDVGGRVAVRQAEVAADVTRQRVSACDDTVDVIVSAM